MEGRGEPIGGCGRSGCDTAWIGGVSCGLRLGEVPRAACCLGRLPGLTIEPIDTPFAADSSLLYTPARPLATDPTSCDSPTLHPILTTPIAADRAAADPRNRAAAQGHRHQRHRLRAPGLGKTQPVTGMERDAQGCGVMLPGRTIGTGICRCRGRSSELVCVQNWSVREQGHPVNAKQNGVEIPRKPTPVVWR